MTTTPRDVQALTYLARRLRDETMGAGAWDEAGTHAVISKLVGQSLAIAAERVLHHAADPKAQTPGAILRPFTPPGPDMHAPRFPARAGIDECRTHPGEHADGCRACAADALAGDPTPATRPLQSVPPPPTYLDARRALSKQPPDPTDPQGVPL